MLPALDLKKEFQNIETIHWKIFEGNWDGWRNEDEKMEEERRI